MIDFSEMSDSELIALTHDTTARAVDRMGAWLHSSERTECYQVMHDVLVEYERLTHSGALVPVPVGEPCERRRCVLDTFEHDGCIYFDVGDGYPPKRISDGAPIAVSWNAIVRPVRLVPIEQWDAEG